MTEALLDAFLTSAVYYPCSAVDGSPLKYLGRKGAKNFFYTDYCQKPDTFVSECFGQGPAGYTCVQTFNLQFDQLFGPDWLEAWHEGRHGLPREHATPPNPVAVLSIFDRRPDYDAKHGPSRLTLLFAQMEGVAAFKLAYSRRKLAPSCIACVRTGIGFGFNYAEYPVLFSEAVRENAAGLPEYLLYDEMSGDREMGDYHPLVEDYSALERWGYETERYGHSELTLARLNPVLKD